MRNRARRGRALSAVPVAACLAAGVVALAACGEADDATALDCAARVRQAAYAAEPDEQVRQLDAAFQRCATGAQLATELERYERVVGFEVTSFIALRCERAGEALADAAACRELAVPATSAVIAADVVFVGETLDGRTVEIRADADTPFVGDEPLAMRQTVDAAVESRCPGVIAQRDSWAAQLADPAVADEASVFTRHAEQVARYIGCVFDPIAITPTATTATTAPA